MTFYSRKRTSGTCGSTFIDKQKFYKSVWKKDRFTKYFFYRFDQRSLQFEHAPNTFPCLHLRF